MGATVYRIDLQAGTVGERRRTERGGLIASANLTRTGVFEYQTADGGARRELRAPEEVFDHKSLATYPLATVTIDHPGRVDPSNWKKHTVGHIGPAVRQNGDFVAGDVHVEHGDAAERAENGDLSEISCGYHCDLDETPGVYRGQPYDAIQRNIRINHVALGPKGWGRMGPDVKLHMDSSDAVSGASTFARDVKADEAPTQAEREKMPEHAFGDPENKKYPLDTPEHVRAAASYAAKEHSAGRLSDAKFQEISARINKAREKFGIGEENKDSTADAGAYLRGATSESTMTNDEKLALEKAQADKVKAEKDLEQARADAASAKTDGERAAAKAREDAAKIVALEAENNLLKQQQDRQKNDGLTADRKRQDEAAMAKRVEEIVAVRADARAVFATADDPEAKQWNHDGKNADAVRREILAHLEPDLKLDGIDKMPSPVGASDTERAFLEQLKMDSVTRLYDLAMKTWRRQAEERAKVEGIANGARLDGTRKAEGDDEDDDGDNLDSSKEYDAMVKRKKDAWKKSRKDRTAANAHR